MCVLIIFPDVGNMAKSEPDFFFLVETTEQAMKQNGTGHFPSHRARRHGAARAAEPEAQTRPHRRARLTTLWETPAR